MTAASSALPLPAHPENGVSRTVGVTYAADMTTGSSNQGPDDAELMLRYRDGDARAFESLYRRYNDRLYRYLLRLCRDRHTAEDLYQEVWSRVIRARHRYQPTAKFATYLYRIAHNCFVDSVRRNRRYAPHAADPEAMVDSARSPEESTEISRMRARMLAALDELPAEQRDVFLLYEEAAIGLEEIAAITGVNRETAKSRLRYANRKLRAALADPTIDEVRK